jgi:hypothetical protein
MKRYFGIIVAVIFFVVAIVWASRKWTEKTVESKREQSVMKLKSDYLERVAWLRNVAEEKPYKDEMTNFLQWYFRRVNEHMNEFGGNRKFDDYLDELGDKSAAKKADKKHPDDKPDKSTEKKAAYEYTKKVFDELKGGNYAPYWTATDKGIRLDILSAGTEPVAGEQKIHMPIVVWVLPRDERVDDRGVRSVRCGAGFKANWKLFDEKGKLYGEMNVEGGPNSRVDWPERYIKFFPPMVVLGHYDIERMPVEVKNAEITFSINETTPTSGSLNVSFVWKVEVPSEWKLAKGETWKGATDSIRPEEEIDPSKAEGAKPEGAKKK